MVHSADVIVTPEVEVRVAPVQARATARVEALLDATAAVVEAKGIESLTTAMVAEWAGTSIGTVYRYFPDRVALLMGLARRNTERLGVRLSQALADDAHGDWMTALDAAFDTHLDAYREIPGYRAVRTGDMIDTRSRTEPSTSQVMLDFIHETLRRRFGFPGGSAAHEALDHAIAIADALTLWAFVRDPHGETAIIDLARRLSTEHLVAHFGDPRRTAGR